MVCSSFVQKEREKKDMIAQIEDLEMAIKTLTQDIDKLKEDETTKVLGASALSALKDGSCPAHPYREGLTHPRDGGRGPRHLARRGSC